MPCGKKCNCCPTPKAFWGLEVPYTIPYDVPANPNLRRINIPPLQLYETDCFIEKEIIVAPSIPQVNYKVLQYIGNKSQVFEVTGATTIDNQSNDIIEMDFFLAIGKDGDVPNQIISPIRKEGIILAQGRALEVTAGLVRLDPYDTVTWFYNNSAPITANKFSVLNFNTVIVPA